VIAAVGLEAQWPPFGKIAQEMTGIMPKASSSRMMVRVGMYHMEQSLCGVRSRALRWHDFVQRCGGRGDHPLPMFTLFDPQIPRQMVQANGNTGFDDILL
jgi:hypothetical protein